MTGFSLLSLNPSNLEKVINKCTEKSYIRLQRTCRDINGFIRTNQKICIYLDEIFVLEYNKPSRKYYFFTYGDWPRKNAHEWSAGPKRYFASFESLHGTRLRHIEVPDFENGEAFEDFCNSLKENRISCTTLSIYEAKPLCPDYVLSLEQCVKLITILNPIKVSMDSKRSNRYEALFQLKKLKSIWVDLDADELVLAVTKLLPRFPDVLIVVKDPTNVFELIQNTLQIFFAEPLPNLLRFQLQINWQRGGATFDKELKDQLRSCNLVAEDGDDGDDEAEILPIAVNLPPHFPDGSNCKIEMVHGIVVELIYSRERTETPA